MTLTRKEDLMTTVRRLVIEAAVAAALYLGGLSIFWWAGRRENGDAAFAGMIVVLVGGGLVIRVIKMILEYPWADQIIGIFIAATHYLIFWPIGSLAWVPFILLLLAIWEMDVHFRDREEWPWIGTAYLLTGIVLGFLRLLWD